MNGSGRNCICHFQQDGDEIWKFNGYKHSCNCKLFSTLGSYEFKPNTDKSLKGGIREQSPGGILKDVVGPKKYSTRATGSFYQEANYSYRVHLSDGYGYGVVTVQ